jgi:CheY-like chemotaxis protein
MVDFEEGCGDDTWTFDDEREINDLIDLLYEKAVPHGDQQDAIESGYRWTLPSERTSTVLLVDDAHVVRVLLRKALEPMGCQILEASDGVEAEEIFLKNRSSIGVIILDLAMTGQDGITTLAHIRKLDSALPVLILTGHSSKRNLMLCAKLGISGFYGKPVDSEKLCDKIFNLLMDTPVSNLDAPPSGERALRVVLAEPHPLIEALVSGVLKDYCLEPVPIKNISDLVQECSLACPDLVLISLDAVLSQSSQLGEKFGVLKEKLGFQVLVYGTDSESHGDEDIDTVALGALVDSVLPAPFDGQELVRVIQSLSGT